MAGPGLTEPKDANPRGDASAILHRAVMSAGTNLSLTHRRAPRYSSLGKHARGTRDPHPLWHSENQSPVLHSSTPASNFPLTAPWPSCTFLCSRSTTPRPDHRALRALSTIPSLAPAQYSVPLPASRWSPTADRYRP